MQMYDADYPETRDELIPRFYTKADQDGKDINGNPVFRDVEYVEITFPRDRNTVVVSQVEEKHRKRWPDHYKAFTDGLQAPVAGIPVKAVPFFGPADVENLLANGLTTIEQAATVNLKDSEVPPQLAKLVQYFKDYLTARDEDSGLNTVVAKAENLEKENIYLKKRLDALESKLLDVTEDKPKRRTRSPSSPSPTASKEKQA